MQTSGRTVVLQSSQAVSNTDGSQGGDTSSTDIELPSHPSLYTLPHQHPNNRDPWNRPDVTIGRGPSDLRNASRTIGRQKTLTRNNTTTNRRLRPMMRSENDAPPMARSGATSSRKASPLSRQPTGRKDNQRSWWTITSLIMTCLCPSPLLRAMGLKTKQVEQAWREKVALCMIIFLLCVTAAFLTFGLRRTLCPPGAEPTSRFNQTFDTFPKPLVFFPNYIIAFGLLYDYDTLANELAFKQGVFLTDNWRGADLTALFAPRVDACNAFTSLSYNCTIADPKGLGPAIPSSGGSCPPASLLAPLKSDYRLFFDWDDVAQGIADPDKLTVFNGIVLNLTQYQVNPRGQFFSNLTGVMRRLESAVGRDGTKLFYQSQSQLRATNCLQQQFVSGFVDKDTIGCFAASMIVAMSVGVIGMIVFIKFVMAIAFHWVISHALTRPRVRRFGPFFTSRYTTASTPIVSKSPDLSSDGSLNKDEDDFYVFLFVTCYSEGEEGIRATLNSLAATDYPDRRKMLFIVCDGQIQGAGNDKSTPDIVLTMMESDPRLGVPHHQSYIAIAEGERQHNMAQAHGGWYTIDGHRVPIMVIVKTGTPKERTGRKAGNRGKRDSQLLFMNFLSRTLLDDRMTPLDYDMFWKIHHLSLHTPHKFEAVLMVDADTSVKADSLTHLVNALQNDVDIIGLCGETRISNKRQSFVTLIQVFEYYISHHLGKGFESVFGGVTCLPGCFCMYRIKAPKGPEGYFVPLLVNPDIVEEYSENVTDTLHKKNLLLLGEDRFLTTLILRNFPKRKMVFVPQAICHTQVPETFRVLLSQRRRWINSTIHNLMELVLVKELCGIFCFSLQFVVAMELLGTAIMPIALIFLFSLIILAAAFNQFDPITLIMLIVILGLPAILIVITTRKLIYVGYMMFYLLALPIWQVILPIYAFLHFDDFSWGETRKTEGDDGKGGHDAGEGEFDSSQIVLKKWVEWEIFRRTGESTPTSKIFPVEVRKLPFSAEHSV
ncbi:chitin synthase [Synchytrium microbalum]|uniref:chitin synthase n=1 Tax=Synchytrium microbalum TaxID=1806994 RepID=A0A507C3V9_9FUNG|nr:chitin synthase [Synchytrium microbalum]TPX36220.1 chitin synthase [Synchytrium microbalum]